MTPQPPACANNCLRSVSDALAVSPEDQSGRIPFDLTGTALGTGTDTFLLRDKGNGIVLENKMTNDVRWSVGDLVRVRGDMAVNPDERRFAYVRHLSVLAHRAPPEPQPTTGREILDEQRNFQFVTVEGVVQGVLPDDLDQRYIWIVLRTAHGTVMGAANNKQFADYNWNRLVDAEVSFTGLVSPASGWRHGFKPFIHLQRPHDIRILLPQPANPFIPDSRQTMPALHRRKLTGRVLAATNSRCYIRTSGNRFVEADVTADTNMPHGGALITLVGFPETDGTRLRLTESVIHTETNHVAAQDVPHVVTHDQLYACDTLYYGVNTDLHGSLVTLTGRASMSIPGNASERSFGLSFGNRLVIVDCSGLDFPFPPDSANISVSGILLAEFESAKPSIAFPVFRAFRLIPRSPDDILIISRPSWWTPMRLLLVLLVLFVALVGVLIWNRSLKVLANRRGTELANEQIAHRAASLKIEERTRLAVEIHDALSQTLTGIALLFDSVADEASTPSLKRFFSVARQMLTSCRKELKGCLWDLRTRTFEEKDMTEALRRALQPYAEEIKLQVRFNVPRETLSETLAHDILRIVRELVVNALRHGHARSVSVAGRRNGNEISFAVTDDGTGFDPESAPGPRDGHFGLQGIRERLKAHRGTLTLTAVRPHGARADHDEHGRTRQWRRLISASCLPTITLSSEWGSRP